MVVLSFTDSILDFLPRPKGSNIKEPASEPVEAWRRGHDFYVFKDIIYVSGQGIIKPELVSWCQLRSPKQLCPKMDIHIRK